MKSKIQLISLAAVLLAVVFLTSCHNDHSGNNGSYDVVYLQSNDFNTNHNAVLAYRHNPSNGYLEQIVGSPFYTNGDGVGNPMQILGPLDSDQELRRSSDGKFLLTVNSGSNTIAVFRIQDNGALSHVPGSPFPSGGETPVSIDVSGHFVFVVNKSQNPLHPTTSHPNYNTFTIDDNGTLSQVAGAKYETVFGTSPTQVLVSKDQQFVFGDDFLGFMLVPPVGTLRSFSLDNGMLSPIAGTPYIIPSGPMPPDNGALGLYQHPSGNPLYVGFPLQGKVGIYTINHENGQLALHGTVPAGKAACWIRTNHDGSYLYVLNSGDNTIQVYNNSDALLPSSIQTLELKNSGPGYAGPGGAIFKTSEPFSLNFSSNEQKLYIVNQHTNIDFSIGNYNYLHSLDVASDGTLSEASEPIQLPVPNTVRPKGSLVISRN